MGIPDELFKGWRKGLAALGLSSADPKAKKGEEEIPSAPYAGALGRLSRMEAPKGHADLVLFAEAAFAVRYAALRLTRSVVPFVKGDAHAEVKHGGHTQAREAFAIAATTLAPLAAPHLERIYPVAVADIREAVTLPPDRSTEGAAPRLRVLNEEEDAATTEGVFLTNALADDARRALLGLDPDPEYWRNAPNAAHGTANGESAHSLTLLRRLAASVREAVADGDQALAEAHFVSLWAFIHRGADHPNDPRSASPALSAKLAASGMAEVTKAAAESIPGADAPPSKPAPAKGKAKGKGEGEGKGKGEGRGEGAGTGKAKGKPGKGEAEGADGELDLSGDPVTGRDWWEDYSKPRRGMAGGSPAGLGAWGNRKADLNPVRGDLKIVKAENHGAATRIGRTSDGSDFGFHACDACADCRASAVRTGVAGVHQALLDLRRKTARSCKARIVQASPYASEYGAKSGELDESALALAAARDFDGRAFARHLPRVRSRPLVGMLLDLSGSMGEKTATGGAEFQRVHIGAAVLAGLADAITATGATAALYGFESDTHVRGCAAFQRAGNDQGCFGKGATHIRRYGKGKRGADSAQALACAGGNNNDGVAVTVAVADLLAEGRRLAASSVALLVFSDGSPAAGGPKHEALSGVPQGAGSVLKAGVKSARRRGVQVYGLGLCTGMSQSGLNAYYGRGFGFASGTPEEAIVAAARIVRVMHAAAEKAAAEESR
jgi:hypothetical protein